MTAEKLTKIVKIVTACATVFIVLLVSIIVAEYIKINALNRKIQDVTNDIDTLSSKKNELETDLDYHSRDIYIEDYARRELRMLKDGEVYIDFE